MSSVSYTHLDHGDSGCKTLHEDLRNLPEHDWSLLSEMERIEYNLRYAHIVLNTIERTARDNVGCNRSNDSDNQNDYQRIDATKPLFDFYLFRHGVTPS